VSFICRCRALRANISGKIVCGEELEGNRLRIALDLDGVLADLHSVLLEKFSRIAKRRITVDMISQWDAADKISPGLTASYESAWEEYNPEEITTYEQNVGILVDQIHKTAPIDIVTAHAETSRRGIGRWLELHHVPFDKLVLVGKGNGAHKLSIASNSDVFIDDNPNLAENAPSNILVFLYSQPWNQNFKPTLENSNVIRITSLGEVPPILAEVSKNYG
jgi:uncharacterized HAD superfamily protein